MLAATAAPLASEESELPLSPSGMPTASATREWLLDDADDDCNGDQ
jgi:hypothetical protein